MTSSFIKALIMFCKVQIESGVFTNKLWSNFMIILVCTFTGMRVSDLHDVRTTLCSAIPSTERDPRAFQLIRASGTKHD